MSFLVDGTSIMRNHPDENEHGHNFKVEPWSRHVVQFEGMTAPCLVVMCAHGPTDFHAYLVIAAARGAADRGVPARSKFLSTRVRSLGYVGPFLREYGSAAQLLHDGASNSLLSTVAAPSQECEGYQPSGGTFVRPASAECLDTSRVPLNRSQSQAVMNLTGGLDVIVVPPGKTSMRACLGVVAL